ncbi:DUF5680 domain-containing protein [Petroclostridium xylanilyticum]|uniref:DUF5680 domain-containing protein n=1 Tax=Petroclostridium xylanilyticum TaxID=1792311 RepID=UPI0018E2A64B|nr:DUF5680 domain-containing protein [Petroclostridium xylanilyticum]
MNCTELALKGFLVRAKRNTYARDGVLSASSRPNSKDLHYGEGDLLYIDSYFGSADFIGEEVVFENQKPIWGMNYESVKTLWRTFFRFTTGVVNH